MEWKCCDDERPENGKFVLISSGGYIGIAHFIDGDFDTVGANRKHYLFTDFQKVYSAASPDYWANLPEAKEE